MKTLQDLLSPETRQEVYIDPAQSHIISQDYVPKNTCFRIKSYYWFILTLKARLCQKGYFSGILLGIIMFFKNLHLLFSIKKQV